MMLRVVHFCHEVNTYGYRGGDSNFERALLGAARASFICPKKDMSIVLSERQREPMARFVMSRQDDDVAINLPVIG